MSRDIPPEDLVVVAQQVNRAGYDLIDRPAFGTVDAGDLSDWRNHIPKILRQKWGVIGDKARVTAFLVAELAAQRSRMTP